MPWMRKFHIPILSYFFWLRERKTNQTNKRKSVELFFFFLICVQLAIYNKSHSYDYNMKCVHFNSGTHFGFIFSSIFNMFFHLINSLHLRIFDQNIIITSNNRSWTLLFLREYYIFKTCFSFAFSASSLTQ